MKNWLHKIAGPQQKIQRFRVQIPSVQSLIYKYERLIPWDDVQNEQDIQSIVAQQLLPSLYEQINPENENSVYLKNIDINQEVQQNPNNPQIQAAYRIYQQNPERGQRAMLDAVNKPKQDTFNQWQQYLINKNDVYMNDPAFQYVVFAPLVKAYGEKTKQTPLSLNAESLGRIYESLSQNPQMNVLKQYNNFLQDDNLNDLSGEQVDNGWLRIPSKTNDPGNVDANVARLKDLSSGKGWCTGSGMAKPYLLDGDFWLLIENKTAVTAIRLKGNKVAEIQGVNNQLPVSHWQQITEFLHNSNFDYENNDHYQRLSKGNEINELVNTNNLNGLTDILNEDPKNVQFLTYEQLQNSAIDEHVVNELFYKDSHYAHPDIALKYVKIKRDNISPRIIRVILTDSHASYGYATEILKGQNVPPEMIQAIAISSQSSIDYVRNVLKFQNVPLELIHSIAHTQHTSFLYAEALKGQNVPDIMIKSISSSVSYSLSYATEISEGQNVPPKIMQAIGSNAAYAHKYAKFLAEKNIPTPPEIIQGISSHPSYAVQYAINLKGQNVPLEIIQGIARDSVRAGWYAKSLHENDIARDTVPPEIIQSIASDSQDAYDYAIDVLQGLNVPYEVIQGVARDSQLSKQYAYKVQGRNVPPEIIRSIAAIPEFAEDYAVEVLQGKNIPPEIIQSINSDPRFKENYNNRYPSASSALPPNQYIPMREASSWIKRLVSVESWLPKITKVTERVKES